MFWIVIRKTINKPYWGFNVVHWDWIYQHTRWIWFGFSIFSSTSKGTSWSIPKIIFYLKRYSCFRILLDSNLLAWSESKFNKSDRMDVYGDIKEDIPQNIPEARVIPVQNNVFVGAEHARDRMMHPWHTCIILFLNEVPVIWFYKKQNTVE